MYNLARLYQAGRGVRRSRREALRWYRAAAARGLEEAIFAVGRLTDGEDS
jgi:TPR repeat protein